MLNQSVAQLLNAQITAEFYSAYLYLDFSSYFQETGLDGFANWYQVQAQEERDHAMLFYQYLHNNSAKVALEAVAKPERKAADTMGTVSYTHLDGYKRQPLEGPPCAGVSGRGGSLHPAPADRPPHGLWKKAAGKNTETP